jgi:dihydrofolate reductase
LVKLQVPSIGVISGSGIEMRRARAKRLIGRENIVFGSGASSQGDGCLHAAAPAAAAHSLPVGLFGSVLRGGRVAAALIDGGLVDELRLIVYPLIAGPGKALFATTAHRRKPELRNAQQLPDGRVSLVYAIS